MRYDGAHDDTIPTDLDHVSHARSLHDRARANVYVVSNFYGIVTERTVNVRGSATTREAIGAAALTLCRSCTGVE